ncbi:hypothetical protein MMC30_005617 [Trapelia coarctata]|nr:hypothetical protein [Trapelia coarctata]
MAPSTRSTRPKPSKRPSLHARKSSAPKTPIHINIYDLLPPGPISTLLWPLGLSLLHTGIVLLDHEYSYGATGPSPSPAPSHSQTGIFHTPPLTPPPGGTHRLTHLQGFTYLSASEIEDIIRDASAKFPGERYNLLSNNCNHFTNYMCKVLTGREMPAWINRAARVGTALPCLVPKEWTTLAEAEEYGARDYEGARPRREVGTGEMDPIRSRGAAYGTTPFSPSDEASSESEDEDSRAGILWHDRRRPPQQRYYDNPEEERAQRTREVQLRDKSKAWQKMVRDTDGRGLPASEVAPPERLI